MSKALVKQLLMSSNYWTLNKSVVQIYGIETALFLSSLAEAETMMSDEKGWFYQTSDTVEHFTGLTRYKQDVCIKQLEDDKVLSKRVAGVPAKRYFKLDYKQLEIQIVNFLQTRVKEIDKLECKNFTTNKELSNKEINKDSNKENPEEVLDKSEKDPIPYKEIIEYLNKKADKRIMHKAEGNRKLIRARWNEGYRLTDFTKVIDNMSAEWLGTTFSDGTPAENYLHPTTLFATSNFDKYLNRTSTVTKVDKSKKNYKEKQKGETDFEELQRLLNGK